MAGASYILKCGVLNTYHLAYQFPSQNSPQSQVSTTRQCQSVGCEVCCGWMLQEALECRRKVGGQLVHGNLLLRLEVYRAIAPSTRYAKNGHLMICHDGRKPSHVATAKPSEAWMMGVSSLPSTVFQTTRMMNTTKVWRLPWSESIVHKSG